jgi:hypothetical protein
VEDGELIDSPVGAPLNYIVEYIYTSKEIIEERYNELLEAADLANSQVALPNHYLVYYSDPEYRRLLKSQGKVVTYPSAKIDGIRTEWFDLGDIFIDGIGLKIIGDIANVSYRVKYNTKDGLNYTLDDETTAEEELISGKPLFSVKVNGYGLPPEELQNRNINNVINKDNENFYSGWAYTSPLVDSEGHPISEIKRVQTEEEEPYSMSLVLNELWCFDYTNYEWVLSGVVGANSPVVAPDKVVKISDELNPPELYKDGLWFVTKNKKIAY